MIVLGATVEEKRSIVREYVEKHEIRRVYALGPDRFKFDLDVSEGVYIECIDWPNLIMYKYYYRLLQDVDRSALIVLNEPLRTQSRNDLTYNCIRHYLNQTVHQLIFSRFPQIDTFDDFAVLFDFDTRSRWKRTKVQELPFHEVEIEVRRELTPVFTSVDVETTEELRRTYASKKDRLFAGLGLKDPHTLPRNLHLMGGKAKLKCIKDGIQYVGRNRRFKLTNLCTYRETPVDGIPRVVFEFCHNFVDFSDFLACTGQTNVSVLITDLKVDRWYLYRYEEWAGRIRDAYVTLCG